MATRRTKAQNSPHTQIGRELLAEQPSELDVVTLWKFPEENFDEWLSLGMGEAVDYSEYLRRVDHAVAEIERQGLSVAYCTASPGRVLGWLNEQGLENTPENRSYAFGILAFQDDLAKSSHDK
jgi:hypothetical protein